MLMAFIIYEYATSLSSDEESSDSADLDLHLVDSYVFLKHLYKTGQVGILRIRVQTNN